MTLAPSEAAVLIDDLLSYLHVREANVLATLWGALEEAEQHRVVEHNGELFIYKR